VVDQFIHQLRVLFPKWSFFDQLGHRFYVKYQTAENKNWTRLEFKSQWKLLNFFCNPIHNLTLAQMSAIDQLARDVQSHDQDEIPYLNSFLIIKSIVATYTEAASFQFAIEASKDKSRTILYTSPWISEGST
jgi:hypothetical protein